MVVFVTGGSGFLGQHLVRTLRSAGHQVRALARSEAAAATVALAGAEPCRGGVTEVADLRRGMDGCEVVVHAAACTEQWARADVFERVNVGGTEAVLEAAVAAGVRRVVHVSTEAVLADGDPLVRVDETRHRAAHPIGDYARTKALAEERVVAANGNDLETIVLRPRLVWGPGDATVLPAVVDAARKGRFVWIDGGRYLTSTCHVTNASHGITLAVGQGKPGGIYFLTDGGPVEFRAFLSALAATAGVQLGNRSIPRRAAWTAAVLAEQTWKLLRLRSAPPITRTFLALSAQQMTVNDSHARAELGYREVLSRDDGLASMGAA